MILAAHQPQYLPYLGLFAKLARCDVFVLMDDVQFSRREWQHRNRIRTAEGVRLLTVPVHAGVHTRIRDVLPADPGWLARHRRIVAYEYRASRHLDRAEALWAALRPVRGASLSTICITALRESMRFLGITTPLTLQSELSPRPDGNADKDLRLLELCRLTGCAAYLSGPGGANYLRPALWRAAGVELRWHRFEPPDYPQLHPGWIPGLSVLDTILSLRDPGEILQGGRS